LERATQTNPMRRHQTVEEFWRELRDATMAQTRPLRRPDGGVAGPGEPDERGHRNDSGSHSFTPSPPPAPTFDRVSRTADSYGRHRFVVPISDAKGVDAPLVPEASSGPFLSPRPGVDPHAGTFAAQRGYDEPRASRPPSRLRRWGVALLLLLAFSGMLYATFRYVQNVRGVGEARPGQQQAGAGAGRNVATGDEYLTTTDVNLRKGPDTSYTKVGLAESGSRVKVLQVSGKWCQVQVIEHSRPKADPNSADEGWVNRTLLRARS